MIKFDIRLLIPALPFDPTDPFAKSLGGSETAGLQLAAAIAKLGHTVTTFASVETSATWNKVNIVPASGFESTMVSIPCDLLIVQRNPAAFMRRYESRVNFLWVHDLMFARRSAELAANMHSIDRICTVSKFQKDQYRQVVPSLPESVYLVSRNGIDLELVEQARERAKGTQREPLIVCGARPERGVDVLLTTIFPRILKEVPEARLALAMYDCPNPNVQPMYDNLQRIAAQFGDRVSWLGPLGKAELYNLYCQASCYLYPTPSPMDPSFSETSCISAMEAMACGCPVVSTRRGGLVETVGGAGVLFDLDGPDAAGEQVVQDFTTAGIALVRRGADWQDLHERGLERAQGFGWEPVAEQFVDAARSILAGQCSDPVRLARHFIARQDIEAATKVLEVTPREELPAPKAAELDEIATWMTGRYAHTDTPALLAAHYADKVGPGNDNVFQGLMGAPASRFNEQAFVRFEMLDFAMRQQLELEPGDKRRLRILDFGCSQGECPIVFANRHPGAHVLGVDASPIEIERAQQLAAAKADHPEHITFAVANETDFSAIEEDHEANGPFDAVIMAEVLEHLVDPVAVVQRLERMVRHAGVVLLTVPYGPWETQQPEPLRGQHLREWLPGDLVDMFVKKPSLVMNIAPMAVCPVTGSILGNTVLHYKADHAPLLPLDWERKLSMQRPRQTLSACMILGGINDSDNLHWCLKPVAQVADEIVIGDTGMTDEARRIALQYPGVRIIEGVPSPMAVGFDIARNLVLDHCREDWVLMVDADEHLLAPNTVWRYLRENIYHSYAMAQHHFAVDAQWKPDLPGRLFRRRPDPEGRVVRFVGRLHEHPEFGVNKGAGTALLLQDVRLAHVGYIEQANRAQRYVRNLPLLKLDMDTHPDRELIRLIMLRDSMIQAKYLLQMSGVPLEPGAATRVEQSANLCRDVIGIFDATFCDLPSGMADEAIGFYNEACQLLGTEVRAEGLSVNRQGVGRPVGPQAAWFATVDHYRRWMARSVKAATENLETPGF